MSVDTFSAPGVRPTTTGNAVASSIVAFMDRQVVPSGSVPVSAEDGDANAIREGCGSSYR